MPIFNQLFDISNSERALEGFLQENMSSVYDLHNAGFEEINNEKDAIERYVELKGNILEGLNYTISQNKAFISILFDLCERFGFISTQRIESTLRKNELYLGKRREAAKLFLLNITCNQDFLDRFDQICTLLQCSLETEEDDDTKVMVTFSNYYAKVLIDTSETYITLLHKKILTARNASIFPFLSTPLIQDIVSVDVKDTNAAYSTIQDLVEHFLGHEKIIALPEEEPFIELDTEYSRVIGAVDPSFNAIREISVAKCIGIDNRLEGRGVLPLTLESEMFIYMKRYGNMHKAKMLSALRHFPFHDITDKVEIIDWGCGQGIATMVYFEFLMERSIGMNNINVRLIDPSVICLSRAALNLKKFDDHITIQTINKDLDTLIETDFHNDPANTKIHFFSNILDVEHFSMSRLIELILHTQKGINYFFCVSPYINDAKADRVDSFKRYFESGFASFEPLIEKTNSGRLADEYWNCNNKYNGNMEVFCHHTECGCENKWTRVIRVFKVVL